MMCSNCRICGLSKKICLPGKACSQLMTPEFGISAHLPSGTDALNFLNVSAAADKMNAACRRSGKDDLNLLRIPSCCCKVLQGQGHLLIPACNSSPGLAGNAPNMSTSLAYLAGRPAGLGPEGLVMGPAPCSSCALETRSAGQRHEQISTNAQRLHACPRCRLD